MVVPLIAPDVEFIPEDDTLGDLINQIRDPGWCARPTFVELENGKPKIRP
jgi:hypothetical protein